VPKVLLRFAKDESAATAIEYAVLIATVSAGLSALLHNLGGALDGTFAKVAGSLQPHQAIVVDDGQ
jgi:Flp pilus assembly pilin Flp